MALNYSDMVKEDEENVNNDEFIKKSYKDNSNKLGRMLTAFKDEDSKDRGETETVDIFSGLKMDGETDYNSDSPSSSSLETVDVFKGFDGNDDIFSLIDNDDSDEDDITEMLKYIQDTQNNSKMSLEDGENTLNNTIMGIINDDEKPVEILEDEIELDIVIDKTLEKDVDKIILSKDITDGEGGTYSDLEILDLRDIEKEINQLEANEDAIDNFKYEDISNTVSNFLTEKSTISLDVSDYKLDIKDIIKSPIPNAEMNALFSILNLKENKKILEKDIGGIDAKLDTDFNNLKKELTVNASQTRDRVEQFLNISNTNLNRIYNYEINKLKEFRKDVVDYLDINKKSIISTELNKRSDLFNRIELITSEVEQIKSTIMNIMGKNFVKVKEEKIRIPRTEKELNSLLNKVTKEVEKLEIKDKSYYDKVMGKVMKMIFAPSRYITNDVRSVIILMNVVGFLFLAIKFRDIFVIAFTSTIIVDLINQIKLSKKNVNADFVIEFAMKSNDIINSITDNVVGGISRKLDINNNKLLSLLDDKINSITTSLTEKLKLKEVEIINSFDRDILMDKIDSKHNRNLNSVNSKYEDVRNEMLKNNQGMESKINSKLELAYETASKTYNKDIYEEGNDNSLVFKPSVKVGRYTIENGKYGFDFSRNFKEGSYLIRVENDSMKEEVLDKIKGILVQHLKHIRPEFLKINLIDTKEMGNDFIEMVSENENITKLYPSEESLSEHLKYSVKEIEKRYKKATKEFEDITKYNEEMINRNDSTFKYEINLFYNISVELIKNNNFRTLMSEGGKSGLSSIVIITDEELLDNRGEKNQEIINAMNCFDFNIYHDLKWKASKGNKEGINGSIIPSFNHLDSESIKFDRTGTLGMIRNVENILEESKKDLVLYEDLEKQYASKLFQKNTLTGIEICVGFRDGNLTKPEHVTLGDNLVHGLMAGMTGAGKSNTINVLLMNLIRSYSPEWLELYMIDFKNIEFNMYTTEVETEAYIKKICDIPHTSMIAGTTDAEYSLSVFQKALKEMEIRKKKLAKGIKLNGKVTAFKKIEEYNRFVMENNITRDYPIIPRVLILLDEFQVMFQIEDDNVIMRIKSYITRLSKEARSMGMHMFFTSQSMDGTLSDDVKGQFAMRWCLEATAETSKSVLGNDASSKLKGKGWINMSGTMDRKAEDNKLFKIPLIPSEHLNKVLEEVKEEVYKLNSENPNIPFHKTDFYDESSVHTHKELKAYLNHPSIKDQRNAILLGPKVIYKDKSIPEHFMMGNDDTENMVITGNDKIALSNMLNGIIENISSKDRTKLLIANFDRTLDGFIDTTKTAEGLEVFNRTSDPLPILEAMCDMAGIRNEDYDPTADEDEDDDTEEVNYNPNIDNRWYVVLIGLNKAMGFNEDYVGDEYMLPLINLLKQGPAKGVSVILNYKPPFRVSKILPNIAHRITSKVDEDTSFELFGGRKAKNLYSEDELSFGLYRSTISDKETKFKIFNFDYSKDLLKPKELDNIDI